MDIRGEPPPLITWYQKDKELKTIDNIEIINIEYNTKLGITESMRQNTGLYRIKAINDYGSDEAEVEITILSAPSKPKGPLKISNITKSGCKLKWEKPEDDGGKPIQAYQIEKLDTSTGRWIPVARTSPTDTEVDIKGLQEGHDYQFRVKAINEEGESEPLETTGAIKAKNPYDPPGKPGIPEIIDYDNESVELQWKPPKDNGGSPVIGYIIEKKEKFSHNWDELLVTPTAGVKAKVSGLKEGQIYQFRVRAVNKAGPGEESDPTQSHLAKYRLLKPHINRDKLQKVRVRAGQIVKFDVDVLGEPPPTIKWIFGSKPLESDGYFIKILNEDYNTKLSIQDTTRKDSGLYKIFAENTSGTDEADVDVIILDKPEKPEGPLIPYNIHKEGCVLKWNKPKDDGGLPLQSYVIEKQDVATGKWLPACRIDPDNTECEIKGLDPNHKYNFRIKAQNEEGESDPLETDTSILAKNPFDAPTQPGLPEIIDWSEDSVSLKWEPPIRDGGAPILGYIVEILNKNTGEWTKAVELTNDKCQATVPKLEEGQLYKFRIKAINKAGLSDASEETNWHKARPRYCE